MIFSYYCSFVCLGNLNVVVFVSFNVCNGPRSASASGTEGITGRRAI